MSVRETVLIVDNDVPFSHMLGSNLRLKGFSSLLAIDESTAWVELDSISPAVVVLSTGLPRRSARRFIESLARSRVGKNLPVVLTARHERECTSLLGLSGNVQHYLVRPFSTAALVAVIESALEKPDRSNEDVLKAGPLSLNLVTHRASLFERAVSLRPLEFKLLQHFMNHPEIVHTREALLQSIWGRDCDIDGRCVDVHIKRVREALGAARGLIETVRGVGYRFASDAGHLHSI